MQRIPSAAFLPAGITRYSDPQWFNAIPETRMETQRRCRVYRKSLSDEPESSKTTMHPFAYQIQVHVLRNGSIVDQLAETVTLRMVLADKERVDRPQMR